MMITYSRSEVPLAFIERFTRRFRDEVLDAYLFDSLEPGREITEAWLETYNSGLP